MENRNILGKLLDGGEPRDAIHVAIMQVVSDEDFIQPGAKLRLLHGTNHVKSAHTNEDAIGVADPFLDYHQMIKKGVKFWMLLFPGTITGLRHQWTHPGIDEAPIPTNESEKWLRTFADKWNFDYQEMISGAMEDEGYVVARGFGLHSSKELEPGDEKLFWYHMEQLTKREFSDTHRSNFGWSCSC